eukprot:4704596-Lingulodinium_polyedra.AAC.1
MSRPRPEKLGARGLARTARSSMTSRLARNSAAATLVTSSWSCPTIMARAVSRHLCSHATLESGCRPLVAIH